MPATRSICGQEPRGARSAEFSAIASRYDREVIVLSTVSSVINTYLQVLAAQDRLRIARDNVAAATRILSVYQERIAVGTATGLDLAQQQSLLAQQRAAIPPLDQQLRQNIATLAVLLGEPPARLTVRGGSLSSIAPQRVATGLPADLLLQRPDIREAEAQLSAANANVESARAALLPSIQLTGQGGFVSAALHTLFIPQSAIYSLAAGVTQPVFDGFRLISQLDLQKGRRTELLQLYRKAIISGFADVERALIAVRDLAEQERLQTESRGDRAARLRALRDAIARRHDRHHHRAEHAAHAVPGAGPARCRQADAAAGDRQPVPGAGRRLGAAGRPCGQSRAWAARDASKTELKGR